MQTNTYNFSIINLTKPGNQKGKCPSCWPPIHGQHDGHLPFCLPGFVKFIMLKLYVFVCIAEINILLTLSLIHI